jgi:hypothetical protein
MHRRTFVVVAAGLGVDPAVLRAQGPTVTIDLSRYPVGPLPPDFLGTLRTGQGAVGNWRIVDDPTATDGKAIEQSSTDPTDYRFPLAVYQMPPLQDLEAQVRFKALSGRVDRAGGLAVRLLDADNYYVVRANALEDNVNLYRVVRGQRRQIAGASARVTSSEWHTLSLRVRGDRLFVSFDGKEIIAAADRTFGEAGNVALWTKADSVTRFEALEIRRLR